MSSQNPREHDQSSAPGGYRWLRAVQTIYHLKLWRVLLTLILLTIVFYIISFWLKTKVPPPFDLLRYIPWDSLAGSCLSVVVIGFVYEWVVRNETEQKLHEVLGQHFQNQVSAIDTQISKAMLTTPELMKSVLAPDMVDEVIRTGLEVRLGDAQLAQEAYDSYLSHLLGHKRRRTNYRCNIYLTTIQTSDIPDAITQKYFDGYIDVRYDTVLQKDSFRFTSAATMEEYNELIKDPDWELCWLANPTRDFPKEVAFKVESMRVRELALNIRTEYVDGKYVIVADHSGLQSMQEQNVTIYYRYKVRIRKRGHLFMEDMQCPTHHVVVEFDYAQTDIHFVNVMNFFLSKTKPAIRYIPSRQKYHKVEIELTLPRLKRGGFLVPRGDLPRCPLGQRSSGRLSPGVS